LRYLRPILVVTVGLWLIVGLAYPLAMTGVSQLFFRHQADASPIALKGRIVASANVGQYFNQPGYFWGRPSATVPPDNPLDSGPSNLGPTSPQLLTQIKAQIRRLEHADPGLRTSQIPISLVETSGSGLDPDITPSSALIQIPRIARVTGLSASSLRRLVERHIQPAGWFGVREVNVVLLNIALYERVHHITGS
jgi:K+-transporting ATPase ATPase C chain